MSLIPVTIVTGLPCSGKSTLIQRLIQHQRDERIVWIAKSFEATTIPFDIDLWVLSVEEQAVEIDNGDMRCVVRSDLLHILQTLQSQRSAGVSRFDRVIIETSGFAEPAPVVQTFFAEESICDQYRLDAVVTLLDAEHAMAQLDAHRAAQDQVGFADRFVLTRTDRVAVDATRALHRRLKRMNPRAQLLSREGDLEMAQQLLDIRGFALTGVLDIDADGLVDAKNARDGDVTSFVFRTRQSFDKQRVEDFFSSMLLVYGDRLLRYKGVVSVVGADQPVVIQGVHRLMGTDADDDWKKGSPRDNRILFIGRDMPQEVIVQGLKDCLVCAGATAAPPRRAAIKQGSTVRPPFRRVA